MLTSDASDASASPRKFRILVIEDDAHIARLILTNLTALGLECHYAADGVAGLQAFHDNDPHLVLLDIMLPGMDGREICIKIRETSTVPIIIMTAIADEGSQLQGYKIGADDYVPKPFNPKVLIARVVAQLRRVYRYDADSCEEIKQPSAKPNKAEETQAESKIPPGWASCEACGYMGPREKFESENALGERHLICPRCLQSEHVSFSIA